MFDEVERVKERRRKRMQLIRIQARDSLPPHLHDLTDPLEEGAGYAWRAFDPRQPGGGYPGIPSKERLTVQVVASLVLVGAAYLLFHPGFPLPVSWKETAREVMSRDFNFAGVTAWYEQRFGSLPALLPSFKKETVSTVGKTARESAWHTPQGWRLVRPFDPAQGNVVFEVAGDGVVTSGETGWVTFVGGKPGFGWTVVLQLAGGREVWYGNLERVDVALHDWVDQGEAIGVAKSAGGTPPQLVLGFRQDGRFVNPADVIVLE